MSSVPSFSRDTPPRVSDFLSMIQGSVIASSLQEAQDWFDVDLHSAFKKIPLDQRALVFQVIAWLSVSEKSAARDAWKHLFSLSLEDTWLQKMMIPFTSPIMKEALAESMPFLEPSALKRAQAFRERLVKEIATLSTNRGLFTFESWVAFLPALYAVEQQPQGADALLSVLDRLQHTLLQKVGGVHADHDAAVSGYKLLLLEASTHASMHPHAAFLLTHFDALIALSHVDEAGAGARFNINRTFMHMMNGPFLQGRHESPSLQASLYQPFHVPPLLVSHTPPSAPRFSRLEAYASAALKHLALYMPELEEHNDPRRPVDEVFKSHTVLTAPLAALAEVWEAQPERRGILTETFLALLATVPKSSAAQKPLTRWYYQQIVPWLSTPEGVEQGQPSLFKSVMRLKSEHKGSTRLAPYVAQYLEDSWYALRRAATQHSLARLSRPTALHLALFAIKSTVQDGICQGFPFRALTSLASDWSKQEAKDWQKFHSTFKARLHDQGNHISFQHLKTLEEEALLQETLSVPIASTAALVRRRL